MTERKDAEFVTESGDAPAAGNSLKDTPPSPVEDETKDEN